MSGIRTIADLLDRCRVDEETGCWIWAGALANTTPSMRIPALGRRTIAAGKAICFLKTGKLPSEGVVWHRIGTCRTTLCVCPDHRMPGTSVSKMAALAGQPKPALVRARIAATRRAQSTISDEVVAEIHASDETGVDLAKRLGVSLTHVCRIRRREVRRDLGFSVFTSWGERDG